MTQNTQDYADELINKANARVFFFFKRETEEIIDLYTKSASIYKSLKLYEKAGTTLN